MYFPNVYLHMFSSGYALTAFHFCYSLWKKTVDFFVPIISVAKWQLWHAVGARDSDDQRMVWTPAQDDGHATSFPSLGPGPGSKHPSWAPVGTAVITELDGVWFWIKVMIRSGRMGRFYHLTITEIAVRLFFLCALVTKYCVYHLLTIFIPRFF